VQGPFTPRPKITTGAGDHFNSGFCLGKLLGFDNQMSLLAGVAASGSMCARPKAPPSPNWPNSWPAAGNHSHACHHPTRRQASHEAVGNRQIRPPRPAPKRGAIEKITPEIEALAAAMLETMHANKGVGLAAQQIGRALQLAVLDLSAASPTGLPHSSSTARKPTPPSSCRWF
jgi:hypothetical protein